MSTNMDHLSPDHFLSLPRPDVSLGRPAGIPDTTTLAAHDFDVDTRTGFMPPQPPLARLPTAWESWELILEDGMGRNLQLGGKPGLSGAEMARSETWRRRVRELQVLPTADLKESEVNLRRAHHVLAWILHFYVHSLPLDVPISIPSSISIPLLQISAHLQLPPVLTYSDNVLYNWEFKSSTPELDNLRCQTLFTGTRDEETFFLTSARIELRGVEALELMRATMDEMFVGDAIAIRRITAYLHRMSAVIKELQAMLMSVRENCAPDVFYHQIRPWFRGADSDTSRKWVFEGLEQDSTLQEPTELSGASAGQSSLVHALDIFLGVDKYSHSSSLTGSSSNTNTTSFLSRMQSYMPRHHRSFLNHLSSNPRPLRDMVLSGGDPKLLEGYNAAVLALKEFRDAHLIIVTLYIVGPARRAARAGNGDDSAGVVRVDGDPGPLRGTGGTELAKFLKGVRDHTAGALISSAT